MKCGACGSSEVVRFEDETFTVGCVPVGPLSGWRCLDCEAEVFEPDSAEQYAAAGDEQVLRDRGDRG